MTQFVSPESLDSSSAWPPPPPSQTEKENKKVYGTNFVVKNPKIIKDKPNVAVIVKAASYQQEIEKQLYQLNNKVLILK